MRLTWLADVLRSAGLQVDEMDGWRTRGADRINPEGLVWHHTATPASVSDEAVDRLLRDGRADLPGPLSQLGLRRDGSFVVVAAGRCNHNGFGTWGNDSIGIEAYNDGQSEPWPRAQLDAYDQGSAAICRHLHWTIHHVRGHKETDPDRKIDPRGIDMDKARARVAALITPAPPEEDIDMLIVTAAGRPARLLAPPIFAALDGTTIKALGAAGIRTVAFTTTDYDDVLKQTIQALTDKDVVDAIEADG